MSVVSSQPKEIEALLRLHCYHDALTISQAARDTPLQILAAMLQASNLSAEHSVSPILS